MIKEGLKNMSDVKNNITADFVLAREDGSLVDSSERSGALNYIEGLGMMVGGIEKALKGLEEGSEFDVVLPPEEMYGQRDEDMRLEVSPSEFNGQASQLEIGMIIEAQMGGGPRLTTVLSVDEEKVVLDTNHPLAGVPLRFSGKVNAVRPATEEELAALTKGGCGCGGHDHGDDHECCGGHDDGHECCGGQGDGHGDGGCGCGNH